MMREPGAAPRRRLHRSPAPTWWPTPRPAATTTPSTRTRRRPQRRPARRDRARHVHDGARRPGRRRPGAPAPRSSASAASSPTRSWSPPTAASSSRSPARPRRAADGLTTVALTVTCGGQKVLGMPKAVACVAERLADHTTLRLGGPATRFVTATTEDELVDAVRAADEAGEPLLVLGGGSNLVVADEGFAGTVVGSPPAASRRRRGRGRRPCGGVRRHRRRGRGLGRPRRPRRRARLGRRRGALRHPRLGRRHPDPERRRLRPGGRPDDRLGAGLGPHAEGRPHLRQRRLRLRLPAQPVQGRPRAPRRARRSPSSSARATSARPVEYAELARTLGVEPASGRRWPTSATPSCACARGKGMVLDADDHDTWSAGSFFTNPFVDPAALPDGAPAWPQPDGPVKTSAAWLIEHAGFAKGHGDRAGRPLDQAHARAHQPRRRPHRRPAGPGPRGPRRGRASASASGWSTSRCWSAASCSPGRRRLAGAGADGDPDRRTAARPGRGRAGSPAPAARCR